MKTLISVIACPQCGFFNKETITWGLLSILYLREHEMSIGTRREKLLLIYTNQHEEEVCTVELNYY